MLLHAQNPSVPFIIIWMRKTKQKKTIQEPTRPSVVCSSFSLILCVLSNHHGLASSPPISMTFLYFKDQLGLVSTQVISHILPLPNCSSLWYPCRSSIPCSLSAKVSPCLGLLQWPADLKLSWLQLSLPFPSEGLSLLHSYNLYIICYFFFLP